MKLLGIFFILTTITKLLSKGILSNELPTPVRSFYFPWNLAKIKHNHSLESLPVWWVENIILISISSLLKLGTFSHYLLAFWSKTLVHILWPLSPKSYFLFLIDLKSNLHKVNFYHLFQVFLALVYSVFTSLLSF